MPAHQVQMISSHGAGDAFIGALAARLNQGAALAEATRFAQAAAALHVTSPVAVRDTISAETVKIFLNAHSGRP